MKKNHLFTSLFIAACLTFSCNSKKHTSAKVDTKPALHAEGQNASGNADNVLSSEEKSAGWILLFDGENMKDHWRGFKKEEVPSAWQVEDGAIVLLGEERGDIVTKEKYTDFELMLDWKIAEGGNSGIIFHVSEDPEFRHTWQTGPEMQILDDERHPDAKKGKNKNRQAGANYDMHPLSTSAVKPAGEFNTVRLVVKDGNVQHYLNGKKVVEYTLWSPEWERMVEESKFASMEGYGRYKSGHIALQDHRDKVWFKNIKIRPL